MKFYNITMQQGCVENFHIAFFRLIFPKAIACFSSGVIIIIKMLSYTKMKKGIML